VAGAAAGALSPTARSAAGGEPPSYARPPRASPPPGGSYVALAAAAAANAAAAAAATGGGDKIAAGRRAGRSRAVTDATTAIAPVTPMSGGETPAGFPDASQSAPQPRRRSAALDRLNMRVLSSGGAPS